MGIVAAVALLALMSEVASEPTPGAFTICMEMFLNGYKIGKVIIREAL